MSRDRRAKLTGKKGQAGFLSIPHPVLESDAYKKLDAWTVKLLVDIAGQFRGANNGDLCATWSVMKEKGWRSPATLSKALKQLLENGLIQLTRQGGRNQCSLYAITWRNIDDCKGKIDVRPTKAPSALYLELPGKADKKQNP
ncbi:MAG: hypothetical protein AWU57_1662 [Marinobacter sp. T13-3]|nr:MAG: hypothetical protein AWU57_1662 [Marinobacter sp. T13-3]